MEARNQPKKRGLPYFGKSPPSAPAVPMSQPQSQPISKGNASGSGQSGQGLKGNLVAMKSRLASFHRGQSSSSATPIATGSAGRDPQPPEVVKNDGTQGPIGQAESIAVQDAGGDVDAAQQAFKRIVPVPRTGEIAVGIVGQADMAVTSLQNLSDTYLRPLQVFNNVVTTLANVHPYAQIALGILTAASNLIIAQANLDNAVLQLLEKVGSVYGFLSEDEIIKNIDSMRGPLANIARVVSACAQFIKDYAGTTSFWKRLGKNISLETQTTIDHYTNALDESMQQYRDCQTRDIQINIHHVLEDLNLEGMGYAGTAGLNTMKRCLENTRREILEDIIAWVNDASPGVPNILWLHGQAGRGKSAIAHTIASWLKTTGGLGSCFCFARDKQGEHREKMLTTISRDLAGNYPAFRRALFHALDEDHTLKATPDLLQQWQKLILEPLSKATGAVVGNVVIVIDALDESGQDSWRRHILSFLASAEAADLTKVRVLLTSRALPDIKAVLSGASHIKALCLDDVPTELVQRDVTLFVSKELVHLKEVGSTEIQQIVRKSNGLFEWARLACEFLGRNTFGLTVKERLESLIAIQSEGGKTLLDGMYTVILESIVPKSGAPFLRYRSVMQQLLMMLEPLSITTLNHMRSLFPSEGDHYDVSIILEYMAPVLGGIGDHRSPVEPLHASFYDFLTDPSRSGDYFIDTSDASGLARAALEVLRRELCFNICGLESSYLKNSQIPDLPERIKKNIPPHLSYSCKFWAKHLEVSQFDLSIAASVQVIVESERVLFWLEVLSLTGALGGAEGSLSSLVRWLEGHVGYETTAVLAIDGLRLVQNFFTAIASSTPHLYLSALPLSPHSSFLGGILVPKFSHLVAVAQGGLKDWPATQLVLQGHTSHVNSVAFSPDGNRIVSGSLDQTVRVWDAKSGDQIGNPLKGHTSPVTSVAFSPDRNRIVSGSGDQTVRVWDAKSGDQIGSPLKGHTSDVTSVAFSPDGNMIVSGSLDQTVRVWDAKSGYQIGSPLKGHISDVSSVAFSPDGNRIVSGSLDQTVRVWDVKSGDQIGSPLKGHVSLVSSVAFSPDGNRIASGSWDETVRVWDAKSGDQIGSPLKGHTDWVTSAAFSPDGNRVVSGSLDQTVRVWDAKGGDQIGSPLKGHTDWVISVAFSPDGNRIVSGSSDKTVRVWDAKNGDQISSPLKGHTGWVTSVVFSPDGNRIVSGSSDETVRVWDAKSGDQIGSPLKGHTYQVESVAFSPDGNRIVSGSSDKTVRVWDAKSGYQIGSPLKGHTDWVISVAFSPDGNRIVSGSSDKTVRVWDAKSGYQIGSPLKGHTKQVTSVAFSPDGNRIVSGSWDETVRVWDAKSGDQIGSPLKGHTSWVTSVAFSPHGNWIVSGSRDETVRVWDAKSGDQIGGPLKGHTYQVESVAFSPDGNRIVSGSLDQTVRVWDAKSGDQIGSPLKGHTKQVTSVVFSPDGNRIVSGSLDKTVRVWDAKSGDQVGSPLKGHTSDVTAVELSPDGTSVISAGGISVPTPTTLHPINYAVVQVHVNKAICFSSVPSHALSHSEELLDNLDYQVNTQPVQLYPDGWLKGPQDHLLLWIPTSSQKPFYSMYTTLIIPRGCMELNLSNMVHGSKWQECFKQIA